MCGGTATSSLPCQYSAGLSPRVRGNPPSGPLVCWRNRTIPACAGEPLTLAIHLAEYGDYPRVCGGTLLFENAVKGEPGLSPRVRGNPQQGPGAALGLRTIPACAGEPARRVAPRAGGEDYPRVCGGTYIDLSESPLDGGTIPACAGEPETMQITTVCSKDYPRVCGGTTRNWIPCWARKGLSPRVRGNPTYFSYLACPERTIPACAGEPHNSPGRCCPSRDYPRVCGGTLGFNFGIGVACGLSPRVRGNQCYLLGGGMLYGTIPACAGEPAHSARCAHSARDYPRVCGGTHPASEAVEVALGLSPRVRGNPLRQSRDAGPRRTIPACAGEPQRYKAACYNDGDYPRVCGGTGGRRWRCTSN